MSGNKKILPDNPISEDEDRNDTWINAFKNKTQSPGSFIYAGPVTETILLGAVALRAGKKSRLQQPGDENYKYP